MTADPSSGLPTYRQLKERTDAPPGSSWNVFGSDDELGTLNLLSQNSLIEAAAEIRTGHAYPLDLPTDVISPALVEPRTPPIHHIFQDHDFHRDEWLDGFYPQFGSQIDGLRHAGHPDYGFYGGADPTTFTPGTQRLGIHHASALPIAGRAVLLDVGKFRESIDRPIDCEAGEAITVSDLEQTREAQGTSIRPGDIVLIRFGWVQWYRTTTVEERRRLSATPVHPGLDQSEDILEWLWDNRISMLATDNFAVECWPARADSPFLTVHERETGERTAHTGTMHRALIGLLGFALGELWDLDALASAAADDNRYTCLLTAAAMPVVGGTGSTANAIAIR